MRASLITVSPTFVAPSELPFTDGNVTPSLHAYVCLMSLAGTYAQHGKLGMALECAWSAFDTARMLGNPGACLDASETISAIMEHATMAGVRLAGVR